ncbi:MAG TPA: T9SS type A sorting domain-containing protein [Bacteroidia bacterium]|nr:T9SS type A sorting domain-containing protein [Bacteroidia bacterium]
MKKFFSSAIAICTALTVYSQGLYNGAYIVMSGPAQIYIAGGTNGDYTSTGSGIISPSPNGIITLEGDWTRNGGFPGFTMDAGTVVMNGGAQSIGGGTTIFNNLTLLGTGTKTLNTWTEVGGMIINTGVLSLGTRPLNLNSYDLTLTNPAPGAITYTTGYVISETNVAVNLSRIVWKMGVSTGIHVFPFGTLGGVQIPLTFNKTSVSGDDITIATRPTLTSANTPWTTGVTHMFDPTLAQDGADEAVIDRWWDMMSATPCTADVTFRYVGSENTLAVPYNTGNLGAQYWDISGGWLTDNAVIGSAPAVLAGVGAVTASGITVGFNLTPWVLSSALAPLPVELVGFNSECNGNSVLLNWTTASEQNNNYFTVERSEDGVNFRSIGTISGAGNSSQLLNYSFTDTEPTTGTTYYRLRQTDYDGHFTTSSLIVQDQCGNGGETVGAFSNGSDVTINIFAPAESNYTVTVYDLQGKVIATEQIAAGVGSSQTVLNGFLPAVGLYMINITGDSGIQYADKLYFQK